MSELNAWLRTRVEGSPGPLWVEGELRGGRVPSGSGHAYFELADARSSIPVFMPSSAVRRLGFELKDGLHVLVEGMPTLYEPRGRLQLKARRVEPVGEGALRLALQARFRKLAEEGLTDPAQKRAIPRRPRPIGVVTSRSGAAFRDVVRTTFRRDPRAHLILASAAVQGPGAPSELIRALRRLDRYGCEAILLVRGGGSLEDLRAFNEESLARAIAHCSTPVVTGVGHETDTTLADLVADARASTPTAAAELVSARRSDLEESQVALERRLHRAMALRLTAAERDLRRRSSRLQPPKDRLSRAGKHVEDLARRLWFRLQTELKGAHEELAELERRLEARKPELRIAHHQRRFEALASRLGLALEACLSRHRERIAHLERRLEPAVRQNHVHRRNRWAQLVAPLPPLMARGLAARRARYAESVARMQALSPLAVLARGYAVVTREDGRAVRHPEDVAPGQSLEVRVHEGVFGVTVNSPKPGS